MKSGMSGSQLRMGFATTKGVSEVFMCKNQREYFTHKNLQITTISNLIIFFKFFLEMRNVCLPFQNIWDLSSLTLLILTTIFRYH